MEKKVIEVKELVKTYKKKGGRVKAIDGVSFSIKRGEIFGFLGPNGAGKSTTIKIMLDFIRPDRGKVFINGLDSNRPESRKDVGFLSENPNFIDSLTGLELLMFSAKMYGLENEIASQYSEELLEELDLVDVRDRNIKQYSKGMIQKLGLALVLIHRPKILILDEPMSGLDPMGRYQFKRIFKRLKEQGNTIFFSSHIIPDVQDLCDRVVIINKGKIIRELDIKHLRGPFEGKDLEEIFVETVNLDE